MEKFHNKEVRLINISLASFYHLLLNLFFTKLILYGIYNYYIYNWIINRVWETIVTI